MVRSCKFVLFTLLLEEDFSFLWRPAQACGGPGHCGETCSALQSTSFPGLHLLSSSTALYKSILDLRKGRVFVVREAFVTKSMEIGGQLICMIAAYP